MKFTYESSSTGYMIFCDGKPLGGAGSLGTATHTADGKRRHWRHVSADAKMHAEQAKALCEELKAGGGPAYMRKNIPAK